MSMDPQIAQLLEMMASQPMPSPEEVSVEEFRNANRLPPPEQPEAVAEVTDRTIPGPAGEIPVRIYRPGAEGPLPLLVYFHGGGFVIGDLDTHDNISRAFANALPAVVVSVDYRLAPEHRFPAAVEDAHAAARWAAENAAGLGADPERVIVGGDSAGGALATVASMLLREEGFSRVAHQLLIYPVTDTDLEREAYRRLGGGEYFLGTDLMRWFWNQYLADAAHAADPRAAPLRAESLAGLPPATVVTADLDPLSEEGAEYADRLAREGVPVEHLRYEGVIHGFMSFLDMADVARRAVGEVSERVRRSVGGPSPR